MRIFETGLRLLHDLFVAVQNAGGHPPVVIDSEDLVANPADTMAAYCAAVELPFIADALNWQSGQRSEWARSSRWHKDAAASSGFEAPARPGPLWTRNTPRRRTVHRAPHALLRGVVPLSARHPFSHMSRTSASRPRAGS
jgi:hypothetical protein